MGAGSEASVELWTGAAGDAVWDSSGAGGVWVVAGCGVCVEGGFALVACGGGDEEGAGWVCARGVSTAVWRGAEEQATRTRLSDATSIALSTRKRTLAGLDGSIEEGVPFHRSRARRQAS